MAISKRSEFDVPDVRLSDLARALAHPARIAILRTLAERQSCICGEIVEVLPLAQSTVSRHLKDLKEAGLITGDVEGPRSCYCLNPAVVGELFDLLKSLEAGLSSCRTADCSEQSARRPPGESELKKSGTPA